MSDVKYRWFVWCRVCAALWKPRAPRSYHNFSRWFGEKQNCDIYTKMVFS